MCKPFSIPNLISLLRILLTPIFVFCLFQGKNLIWIATILFAIAAFTDFFDGYIARRYNLSSHLGRFLDPLADKIATGSAFISFSLLGLIEWWIVLIIVIRDFWITGLRVFTINQGYSMKTSMLAKCKTTVQLIAIGMLFATYLLIQYIPTHSITTAFAITTRIVIYIVAVATFYSGFDYVLKSFTKKTREL